MIGLRGGLGSHTSSIRKSFQPRIKSDSKFQTSSTQHAHKGIAGTGHHQDWVDISAWGVEQMGSTGC